MLALKSAHGKLRRLNVSVYLTGVLNGLKGNDYEILKTKTYISAKQSISGYVQDKPKYEFPEKWDKP